MEPQSSFNFVAPKHLSPSPIGKDHEKEKVPINEKIDVRPRRKSPRDISTHISPRMFSYISSHDSPGEVNSLKESQGSPRVHRIVREEISEKNKNNEMSVSSSSTTSTSTTTSLGAQTHVSCHSAACPSISSTPPFAIGSLKREKSFKQEKQVKFISINEGPLGIQLSKSSEKPSSSRTRKFNSWHGSRLPSPRIQRFLMENDEKGEKEVDLNSFKKLEGKKEDKFNKNAIKYLNEQWEKAALPQVSKQKVRKAVYLICRKHVEKLYLANEPKDITKLFFLVSSTIPSLLAKIKENPDPLKNIAKRIKFLSRSITQWQTICEKTTAWSVSLTKWLEILTWKAKQPRDPLSLSENFQIIEFRALFYKFENKSKFLNLVPLVSQVFGDSLQERNKVWQEINRWDLDGSKNISLINKLLMKACGEVLLENTLPYAERPFMIEQKPLEILKSQITSGEIYRCIKPDQEVLFSLIIINKKVFYQDSDGPDNPFATAYFKFFWFILFSIIYEHLDSKLSKEEIENQVRLFEEGKSHSCIKNFEEKIPCLSMLKLLTNSCWGVGELYFNELFPDLKRNPYWLKLKPGIEAHLHIASNEIYKNTLIKTYTFFPLLHPEDAHSFAIDKSRPLACFKLSWTVKRNHDKWFGYLKVLKDIIFYEGITNEEKSYLLRSLSNFNAIKNL